MLGQHMWKKGCFRGDTYVLMFILWVKRQTVGGKTKTCLGRFRPCMCVYVLEMYLYVSVYVCDRMPVCLCVRLCAVCVHTLWVCECARLCVYMKDRRCVYEMMYMWLCVCVCSSVWWHLLCCWLRAWHSRLQEPQTKEMKAEVTTWTAGKRHIHSHNTQTQSHTWKRKNIHTDWPKNKHRLYAHAGHTHCKHMCLSNTHTHTHTQPAWREHTRT